MRFGSALPVAALPQDMPLSNGNANAAPYSFFNGMSEDPPLVVLGLKRRDSGPKKDTARNIEETGEFVVHLVNWEMHQGMLVTAADFPEGVDEIPLAGFTTQPSNMVKPPRIAEARVDNGETVLVTAGGATVPASAVTGLRDPSLAP